VPVTKPDQWVEAIVAAVRRPDRPRPIRTQRWEDTARLTEQVYDQVLSAGPGRDGRRSGS